MNDHKVELLPFSEIEDICLMYKITNDVKKWEIFINLVKKIRSNGNKKVTMVVFFEGKEAPDFLNNHLYIDILTKKDISWCGIPNKIVTTRFKNNHYDVVIDLCEEDCIPLQYFTTISNSKLRIGNSSTHASYYDLMIERKLGKDIEKYFGEIEHYLNVLSEKK